MASSARSANFEFACHIIIDVVFAETEAPARGNAADAWAGSCVRAVRNVALAKATLPRAQFADEVTRAVRDGDDTGPFGCRKALTSRDLRAIVAVRRWRERRVCVDVWRC
jgi:hypothetical protein